MVFCSKKCLILLTFGKIKKNVGVGKIPSCGFKIKLGHEDIYQLQVGGCLLYTESVKIGKDMGVRGDDGRRNGS